MPDALLIRAATPADQPALGKLGAVMVSTHHAFDPKRFIAPSAGTEKGYGGFLVSQIDATDRFVLVAARGGEVLAYAYAGLEGPDWMALRGPAGALYDIVVDPGHRQRGVGRILLDAVLTELEARGASQIVLSTAEPNVAAQRLFAAAGFRRTMIEMTKDLA